MTLPSTLTPDLAREEAAPVEGAISYQLQEQEE
jgi:hypothetical protein